MMSRIRKGEKFYRIASQSERFSCLRRSFSHYCRAPMMVRIWYRESLSSSSADLTKRFYPGLSDEEVHQMMLRNGYRPC